MGRPRTVCSSCSLRVPLIDLWNFSIFFFQGDDFFKHLKKGQLFCDNCANEILFDIFCSSLNFYKWAHIYKVIADETLKARISGLFLTICPDCNEPNLSLDYFVANYPILNRIQRNLLSGIGISPNITDGILFCEKCVIVRETKAMEKNPDSNMLWFHQDQNKRPMVWSLVETPA